MTYPPPEFQGGDGYSEAWEAPCPGCGLRLTYQRYLVASMGHGRWCNEDRDALACPACAFSLDGVVPAGMA